MKNAAVVASKSSNAMWQSPNGDFSSDSISHNLNLYGSLNIKADHELAQEDIKHAHLVLIGTARQNKIVASIEDRLPVSFSERTISFSDGETYEAPGLGLGLVYYNPDQPKNLIFWVASNNPELYREDSPVPALMSFTFSQYPSTPPAYDCLISKVDQGGIVVSKRFDSHWNWISRDQNDPLISSSIKTMLDFYVELSNSIRKASASDFSFVFNPDTDSEAPIQPGITRLSDLSSHFYYEPIGIITLKGADLIEIQAILKASGQIILPEPTTNNVMEYQSYKLAVNQLSIWNLVPATKVIARDYRLTDLQMQNAVQHFFPVE